jgi:methylenetetrahydrofolate--tRNA-(uracil-5-)-methyltransferase
MLPDRASGILISELKALGSQLLQCARASAVPAGSALAVDRELFAETVSNQLQSHPRIRVIREEVRQIPSGLTILATGPLTSPALSEALAEMTDEEHLYFYDALSPIVEADSIGFSVAFRGSRYGRGKVEAGDYINCPFTAEEYEAFVDALLEAEQIPLRSFEQAVRSGVRAGLQAYFEGCLPVEVIAGRGRKALAFGPMRPVGLIDPRTGKRPYAVVQLRQDNLAGSLYNLVGFQTNLTFSEQRRVFRKIPGLNQAQFVRFGQMHRNTFINAPILLRETLQTKASADLFFAGQITGVEGYLGNIATGLLAGLNASRFAYGQKPLRIPKTTMIGALCHYIAHASPNHFQPMKANLGILPALEDGKRLNRKQRASAHADRSSRSLKRWIRQHENVCA